jgi:uncharacterized protein YbjQ (UPF0145 family)
MGFFDWLRGEQKESFFLPDGTPRIAVQRLEKARTGAAPWISTLTPAELSLAKRHGLRMLSSIAASCWMGYGYSWTEGHAQGWRTALARIKAEAARLGANAVVDARLVSVPLEGQNSMDYSIIGTAVRVEGLDPSKDPVVATVPALEFVELLAAGIVPVGLAVGAAFEWTKSGDGLLYRPGYGNNGSASSWQNQPLTHLTDFWEGVRRRAHRELRADAARQGRGVLAQVQFGELIEPAERESQYRSLEQWLGRHIVIGTVVDYDPKVKVPHKIEIVLDMSETDALTKTTPHHAAFDESI